MRDERGFTLIELLASMGSFLVVLTAILMMTTVATHNQDRIAKRVAANQRARPVLTQIMDNLRSGCVAPRVAPVVAGSNTSVSFLSRHGRDVSPVPDLRVVTLSGTTLSESIYPATGGAPPAWTFSGTPTSTRTLLTDVSAPSNVMFRYYRFLNSQLAQLTTPLSSADAARTAQVSVTLTAAPSGGASVQDPTSPITLSDTADLRLESASQVTTQDSPPCA